MLPEALTALREATAAIREQIPKGELTLASVERLLQAADAVDTAAAADPSLDGDGASSTTSPRTSKRQVARARWAKIARQNTREARRAPVPSK